MVENDIDYRKIDVLNENKILSFFNNFPAEREQYLRFSHNKKSTIVKLD